MKQELINWINANGDNTYRINYDELNENSIVFDVGGYLGNWSYIIYEKYKSNIYIFEPVKEYYDLICTKFTNNDKIKCFNFGLSYENRNVYLNVSKESSSEYIEFDKKELVKIVNILEFIENENIKKIDLIKINIEGEEYNLLENIFNFDIFENLQIQFHDFIENCDFIRNKIYQKLKLTHELTYCYNYIWENWKKTNNINITTKIDNKIYLSSNLYLENITVQIKINEIIIYSIKLNIEPKFEYWFIPDNKSYLNNSFHLELLNNEQILYKRKINKRLFFYNYYHNGDIHFSREFVKDIISKTNFDIYYYAHNNKLSLLKDIENIKEIKFESIGDTELNNLNFFIKNDDIYINTWIGQLNMFYLKGGLNINSVYNMYKDIYNFLNIDMDNYLYYLPTYNFNFIEKNKIDLFFNNKTKNILICNGDVLSRQSTDQKLEPFILDLSYKYQNFNFILTNSTNKIKGNNIFYTDDIINIDINKNSDLLEISYLSKFCDIIIGKNSGPFSFSNIKENYLDNKKTFIEFSNDKEWVFYLNGKCKYEWSNNYNFCHMYNIIKKIIENYDIL